MSVRSIPGAGSTSLPLGGAAEADGIAADDSQQRQSEPHGSRQVDINLAGVTGARAVLKQARRVDLGAGDG